MYSDCPITLIPQLLQSPDYTDPPIIRHSGVKVTTNLTNMLPEKATAILNTTKIVKSTILKAAITVHLDKKMRL